MSAFINPENPDHTRRLRGIHNITLYPRYNQPSIISTDLDLPPTTVIGKKGVIFGQTKLWSRFALALDFLAQTQEVPPSPKVDDRVSSLSLLEFSTLGMQPRWKNHSTHASLPIKWALSNRSKFGGISGYIIYYERERKDEYNDNKNNKWDKEWLMSCPYMTPNSGEDNMRKELEFLFGHL